MIAITSEAEAMEEIMQKQRKDDLFNKSLKRPGSRLPTRGVEALTCSEAEVDALLSDGEST